MRKEKKFGLQSNNNKNVLFLKEKFKMSNILKKYFLLILVGMYMLFGGVMNGCSPLRKTIIEYKTEYVKKDSVNIRDSVIVVPVERYVDVVPEYDTLYLQTSLAQSKSWVDTTLHMLKGSIENKNKMVEHIKYVDKWHTKDSLVYVTKEVPVDKIVKVKNKTNGFLLGWFICSILAIVAFILKKLRLF